MSHQGRSLGEVAIADAALVRPDLGVHQHVLIVVALRGEELGTELAIEAGSVLALVIHELARSIEGLVALVAAVSLHVLHQMVLQLGLAAEFLVAQAARIDDLLAALLLQPFLVPPLVGLDVLHGLAAEATYVVAAHVDLGDVKQQVLLQLILFAAVIALDVRLDVAVHAHIVRLERLLAFVLEVADTALEVRVGNIVGLAMAC